MLCTELQEIQLQEADAVEQFNERINEIIAQFSDTLNELADKRVKLLTDPTMVDTLARTRMSDVERCYSELSLSEISGVNRPVDERYQAHGTVAWPMFWLHALMGCQVTKKRVSCLDKRLLGYLRDIRCRTVQVPNSGDTFDVEFYFAENPFFSNAMLKRRFNVNGYFDETYSASVAWKDNAEKLAEELPSFSSDGDFNDISDDEFSRVSFLDFFQPFSYDPDDLNVALAIKDRICRDPLKYVLRCESARRGDDVEYTDDEDASVEDESNYDSAGSRYPFSWLF
ncbi:nucleosome assembly protein [Babesia ovata]|uniref:Nucleosome assembly protein n=1 Tax=Babesia ovata TaxID=189622 RepID=A0A2H6KEX6_9APIC|nr:nucleosome assembly protein [Babesia ovata]GBE61536.1 nucleosome assembly protein [Babesia ovata]